ncbi:acyltransferase [Alteromonas gracilis]|uniref:acyltransferase n=1 Tax=Alteromonas gracilis TaxID=1479524 RepID=UPI003735393B
MKLSIEDAKKLVKLGGEFCEDSYIEFSEAAISAINNNSLIVKLKVHGKGRPRKRFSAYIGATSGEINISTGGNDQSVRFGEGAKGYYVLRMTGESKINIGENTTSNGTTIYTHDTGFRCGKDCMFSSEVLIQTSDQHAIVDLNTGDIINLNYSEVALGDHVWLGRRSTVVAGSSIASGSIVGTASVVSGLIPESVIIVGSPARIVRTNVTWSRDKHQLDDYSSNCLAR